MSPREIQGLQSLAQAHGRSLTMNPQTGLPEAGILEDILPSIAGFAMDAFAPGSGTIFGGIASLMGGKSSSEPVRSNPMGLASTSLERGLQAGFGTDIYEPSSKQMSEKESPAGSFGAIQSAINTAPPKDYLQDTKYNMYSAPQRYDSGGMTIGNVGAPVDASGNPIVIDPYDTRTDSQKAQDYLLGKPGAVNPFLFYHGAIPKEAPAALTTAEVSALAPNTGEAWSNRGAGGSGSFDKEMYGNPWDKLSDEEKAQWFGENQDSAVTKFQKIVEGVWPYRGEEYQRQLPLTQGISPKSGLSYITPPSYFRGNTPVTPSSPAVQYNVNQPGLFDGMDRSYWNAQAAGAEQQAVNAVAAQAQQDAAERAALQAEKQAAVEKAVANENNTRYGEGSSGTVSSNTLSSQVSQQDRANARDSDARGGYLDNGKFDQRYAYGGGIAALAQGGYNLGSYSDGGRLLRGPGDGISDDIPATIGQNQPARLADGEFVVPARIVSELGNGSTEAGARKLYAMMDRVQKARSKTVGKDKVAANSRADKYLPS